jgi:transcriptional regulator with XRE-family HTH domain
MGKRSRLISAPPHAAEQAVKTLGANLRVARERRLLSLEAVAEKIGVGRRVVADAEGGKLSTGVIVYVSLLWAYGLLGHLADVADPGKDKEGTTLDILARRKFEELSNDF